MFHGNKSRDAWLGMKIASGQSKKTTEIKVKNEPQYANDLNTFYSRFDKFDFKDKCKQLEYDLRHNDDDQIEVSESDVCRSFRGLNMHKASGPDKICGNVLRSCCYELAGILLLFLIGPLCKVTYQQHGKLLKLYLCQRNQCLQI